MSTSNIPDGCEPFDLQRALAGVPVVTRDGREVTQLHKFDTIDRVSLRGVIAGRIYGWALDGRYCIGSSDYDLFLRSEPRYVAWTLAEVPLGLCVRRKSDGLESIVETKNPANGPFALYIANVGYWGAQGLLNDWTQLDGTPCGRREG